MPHAGEFRLSITRALGDQLAEALSWLTPEPLEQTQLNRLLPRPGVYQLYEDTQLVYVGKADTSLPDRLMKHHRKIEARLNVGAMGFTCIYVDEDLHAVAPERLLINRYRSGGGLPWNGNGFGSNDPGRNRDETVFESTHFDSLHPANLDWICEDIEPGVYAAAELLRTVKAALPYVFRYQSADFHHDIQVTLRDVTPTADELFTLLGGAVAAEDDRWQITALPGYVIMYPRSGPYPSAQRIYR